MSTHLIRWMLLTLISPYFLNFFLDFSRFSSLQQQHPSNQIVVDHMDSTKQRKLLEQQAAIKARLNASSSTNNSDKPGKPSTSPSRTKGIKKDISKDNHQYSTTSHTNPTNTTTKATKRSHSEHRNTTTRNTPKKVKLELPPVIRSSGLPVKSTDAPPPPDRRKERGSATSKFMNSLIGNKGGRDKGKGQGQGQVRRGEERRGYRGDFTLWRFKRLPPRPPVH